MKILPIITALAALCLLHVCRAAEPAGNTEPGHTTIPNARAAGPGDFEKGTAPVMWIGVEACGEYVIWLVFEDHIGVVDKDHHPNDMKAFMRALEESKIPNDFRTIECTTAST